MDCCPTHGQRTHCNFTLCHGLAARANLEFRLADVASKRLVYPAQHGEVSPWDNVSACYNEYLWQIRCNRDMKSKPHTLTTAAGFVVASFIWMQHTSSQEVTGTRTGRSLVHMAAEQLLQLPPVETRIQQTIDLAGQQLVGTGTYRQAGTPAAPLIRLELRVQMATGVASLQQIRNQRFLWTRRAFTDRTVLERIDLLRVNEALATTKTDVVSIEQFQWIASGGVPALLKSLERKFLFGSAHPRNVDQVPVWVIEGQWKPTKMPDGQPASQSNETAQATLAHQHTVRPDRVRLLLGRGRPVPLFPYRIVFYTERNKIKHSVVAIEFFDIRKMDQVDQAWFEYQPGDQDVEDITDDFLKQFGVLRNREARSQPVSRQQSQPRY